MGLTIWTNSIFTPAATRLLQEGTRAHNLIISETAAASVLAVGASDPALATADIVLGQPNPADCIRNPRIQWIEVTSAGYTRFDTPEFFEAMRSRGAAFTNASDVFADPCAQHVLAMMLAFARQILPSYRDQLTDHSWHYDERRYHSRLLTGQTVLLLGFGAIGRRLAQLLAPFGVKLLAFRRQATTPDGVRLVTPANLSEALAEADHIINILPANPATDRFLNAERLACAKPSARLYNIGRGSTLDQAALAAALRSEKLGCAYLDVTDVEPLPPGDELWTTPNCYITPHTAGGRHDQDEALVQHFLHNLEAFQQRGPWTDRVV